MQGIRPAVAGLISSAGLSIGLLAIFGASTLQTLKTAFSFDAVALGIALTAFIVSRTVKKINPVIVIILSGAVGMLIYSLI